MHILLSEANRLVYQKIGLVLSNPLAEEESSKYGAYTFTLGTLMIRYRVANITATKTGQFVTLWKRKPNGPIQPFDIADPIDFFIISTKNENNFGQFIFPKAVLNEKGILSGNNKEGKLAIRVYPPWDNTTSKQATKTQQWQLNYFLEITDEVFTDVNRAVKLFNGR